RGLDDHGERHAPVAAVQHRRHRAPERPPRRVRRSEPASGHQGPARRAGPRVPRDPGERDQRAGLRRCAHRPRRGGAARSDARGQGITVKIDGAFDDRAMSDLTNELRNAGAEAISLNDVRVGPRSWYAAGPERTIVLDGRQLNGPWTVKAIGASDVMYVAITRTGGIEGQFELIYPKTRFSVTKETSLEMPAV